MNRGLSGFLRRVAVFGGPRRGRFVGLPSRTPSRTPFAAALHAGAAGGGLTVPIASAYRKQSFDVARRPFRAIRGVVARPMVSPSRSLP
jgi:hypothetical protein